MFFDYQCLTCGRKEERNVSSETRDSQACGAFDHYEYNVVSGDEGLHYCNGAMKRLPHYQSLAIHPQGIAGVFMWNPTDPRSPELARARTAYLQGDSDHDPYVEGFPG